MHHGRIGLGAGSMSRRLALAVIGLTCAAPSAARAHHGWSEYGADVFALEGTVRELRLGNPHDLVRIEDRQGRIWDAVLGPPSRDRAAGLIEGAVRPGDAVRAGGRRHRDPDRLEMKTERLEARGRRFDIYPERLSRRGPAPGR
jgi:Family of unknown function (DUF6152)